MKAPFKSKVVSCLVSVTVFFLYSEPPAKSPYAPSTQTTATPLTQSSPQSGRPRPPPPPADVPVENTPPPTTTPIKPVQPTKPVVRTRKYYIITCYDLCIVYSFG